MPITSHALPAVFSLTAMGIWGASDFLGGVGARRVNAFLFTAIVHLAGVILMGSVSLATAASFPTRGSIAWSLLAGAIGGGALALFYRALASGKMGLTAPVAAVLGAGIPTLFSAVIEGFPGYRHLFGFALAGLGVWLISRSEGAAGRPEGLGLAVIAGTGFACFYLCIHQAGDASAAWTADISRVASLLITTIIVLVGRNLTPVPTRVALIAACTGFLDVTGSFLFVRANQLGRLDTAVVLSSLYPAITVLLARFFLKEHFSRGRTFGMLAALVAVPMIAG